MRIFIGKVSLVLGIVLSTALPAGAQLGLQITHDPWNELVNAKNLAQSTNSALSQAQLLQNNFQQLANEAQNLRSISPALQARLQSQLSQLGQIMDRARVSGLTSQNYATTFAQKFPTYRPGTDFGYDYRQWSANTTNAAVSALQSAGVSASADATMAQNLQNLAAQSGTASGQLSVAQVGNSISIQTTEQLAKLRTLQQAQLQAEAAYYLNSVNTSAGAARAADGADLNQWLSTSGRYHSGQIKNGATP